MAHIISNTLRLFPVVFILVNISVAISKGASCNSIIENEYLFILSLYSAILSIVAGLAPNRENIIDIFPSNKSVREIYSSIFKSSKSNITIESSSSAQRFIYILL